MVVKYKNVIICALVILLSTFATKICVARPLPAKMLQKVVDIVLLFMVLNHASSFYATKIGPNFFKIKP